MAASSGLAASCSRPNSRIVSNMTNLASLDGLSNRRRRLLEISEATPSRTEGEDEGDSPDGLRGTGLSPWGGEGETEGEIVSSSLPLSPSARRAVPLKAIALSPSGLT